MNNIISARHFQTDHVSIFQNGIAFFQKRGEVDASSGLVKLDELPVNVFAHGERIPNRHLAGQANSVLYGSFSIYSKGNPLLRTSVYLAEEESQVASTTISEILSNNLDQEILLTLKSDPTPYSGKIVSLTDGVLLIQTEQGWKQIRLDAIDHLDFAASPNLLRKKVTQKNIFQLEFTERQSAVPIELVYFQRGITWLPNYHLELLGNNQARLSLKANVLNDGEDLHDVAVDLVLGNSSFSIVEEPLFSDQSLSDFMRVLRNKSYSSSDSENAMVRSRASYNTGREDEDFEKDGEAAGELSDEDQFSYPVKHLSLPKGGRMLIHLLETNISYENVYSTRLENKQSQNYGESDSPGNTVWHSIKFKNTSGFPLPTGAIAFVKNENGVKSPISINQLDFVPAGLVAGVNMTKVPDIVVFDYEKIIDIKEKAKQNWKLCTMEATIEAGNFKNKPITLKIERELSGELLSSDVPWTVGQVDEKELNAQNRSREVSWVFTLQPGEQKKITYSYTMYLP